MTSKHVDDWHEECGHVGRDGRSGAVDEDEECQCGGG